MLFALLQLHVAHPDNLTHEADAGPDEVHTAEVLKGQRVCKTRSLCNSVSSISLFTLQQNTVYSIFLDAEISE